MPTETSTVCINFHTTYDRSPKPTGSPIPARDILGGRVPPPEVASRLYEVIEAAEGLDEAGLPEAAYVPTETGEHVPVYPHERTVFDADATHQ
jgi:hypothetical protein